MRKELFTSIGRRGVSEEETSEDDESEPLEPLEEGQGLLLHIDGAEEDLDQSEQGGHLQALEEAFQQFTHITHTQDIDGRRR